MKTTIYVTVMVLACLIGLLFLSIVLWAGNVQFRRREGQHIGRKDPTLREAIGQICHIMNRMLIHSLEPQR